jgi:hypothetical protein
VTSVLVALTPVSAQTVPQGALDQLHQLLGDRIETRS